MTPTSNSQVYSATRVVEIEALLAFFDHVAHLPVEVGTPQELAEYERQVRRATDRLAGLVVGECLQASLGGEEVGRQIERIVEAGVKPLKYEGTQAVGVGTASGVEVRVNTRYYRRKAQGNTHRRLPGLYPGLAVLGIYEHGTPALCAEVSMLAAALSSFKEARQLLGEHGVALSVKRIQSIAYAFSHRARGIGQSVQRGIDFPSVAGRQVVISCDGGRIRIRTKKRGPRTKKGRCRYRGVWREPKLLVVSVLGADGHQDRAFAPLIDATLYGPDVLFDVLENLLEQVHIEQAKRIMFVADGAHWIWKRVQRLRARLGLGQLVELLDFYHVVEHLGEVAQLKKAWTQAQRRRWVKRQRSALIKGRVDTVIKAIGALCRGRCAKSLRCQREYFTRNAKRLDYPGARSAALPIGSGVVESAVRRVVNLRLKGASIYWLKKNAEAMLMLRCYYKAGRWNLLTSLALPAFRLARA